MEPPLQRAERAAISTSTDPIVRAKRRAAALYPGAEIRTKSALQRPVVWPTRTTSFASCENGVVATFHQRGKPHGSDSWVEMDYAIVYTVEEGLITRGKVYATPKEALEAVRAVGVAQYGRENRRFSSKAAVSPEAPTRSRDSAFTRIGGADLITDRMLVCRGANSMRHTRQSPANRFSTRSLEPGGRIRYW
jgi:hypothetical protein